MYIYINRKYGRTNSFFNEAIIIVGVAIPVIITVEVVITAEKENILDYVSRIDFYAEMTTVNPIDLRTGSPFGTKSITFIERKVVGLLSIRILNGKRFFTRYYS